MRRLSTRTRWAVPVGAAAVTGIVIAASAVASADAAPSLAPRSPQQLLTAVAQGLSTPLGPLTATVQSTANLGLPALPVPDQQGESPIPSSGPQSVSFWYRDARHFRVAEQVPAGETDLRRDGRTVWVWNSKTQTATRYLLPAQSSRAGAGAQPVPNTPPGAAAQLLKAIGPTTVVSVQRNVYVAGRAAYQLSLVPRSSKSLVGSVLIAIDASRYIPLRVEVFPRGSSTVAYSIGFTALSFGPPAASNFSFTPPPGATVKTVTVPGSLSSLTGPAGLGQLGLGQLGLGQLGLGQLGLGALVGGRFVGAASASGQAAAHAALAKPLLRVVKGADGKLVVVKPGAGKSIAYKLIVRKAAPGSWVKVPATAIAGTAVPTLPAQARKQIEAQFARSLPASMSKAQRAATIKNFDQHLAQHLLGRSVVARLGTGKGSVTVRPLPASARLLGQTGSHVIGSGWLSVVATPPNAGVAAALQRALHGGAVASQQSATTGYGPATTSSGSQAYSATLSVSPAVGPDLAVLQALLHAMVPVHGSWGSGRLLKTTLLTVLITSKGQILAGAVTPAALYADVAADAG